MPPPLTLTLGVFLGRLETWHARAGSHGNHPLAVSVAVEFERDRHLHGVGDAGTRGDDQRGGLGARGCLGEYGEAGDGGGALLEEDPGRYEGHAGAQVLEGQVKAGFGERPEAPQFGVYNSRLQQREALIRGDGVHLQGTENVGSGLQIYSSNVGTSVENIKHRCTNCSKDYS